VTTNPVTPPPAKDEPPAAKDESGPPNPDRRLFLARACALTAGGVAALAVGSGVYTAFRGLRTVRATVPIAGLDPRLSGFRIAVISDTHLGPFLRKDAAESVVTMVNREQVDMVTVLGDLADGSVEEVGRATEPLRRLESRQGTYFITGNHEYSSEVDPWVEKVRELGMRPLLNERVEIAARGAAFDLAGVNDLIARFYDKQGPDLDAALGGRDTSRPVILLAHQPVQVHEAAKYGVDLQLSGHTHGGQTAPFDRLVGVQQPVTAGLAKLGRTSLFVTRGVGFFGPPVRLGIPPEVAIVELQAL
jgi:predicted MPP superfamily phosphohydrolase